MHIGPSALGLDAALEAPIVAIVRYILDLQIVNAAFRMEVQSEKWEKIKQKKVFLSHNLQMSIKFFLYTILPQFFIYFI